MCRGRRSGTCFVSSSTGARLLSSRTTSKSSTSAERYSRRRSTQTRSKMPKSSSTYKILRSKFTEKQRKEKKRCSSTTKACAFRAPRCCSSPKCAKTIRSASSSTRRRSSALHRNKNCALVAFDQSLLLILFRTLCSGFTRLISNFN